jgi:glycosyltransferase involved in cell wall biosynthesis
MSSARLSYIVTVFNKRPWIADLAASIIAQDAGPVEVVFVDDHSTDGSQEETERACASLRAAGHDARHIRLAENCGPAVATNVGIRCALGEWLFFIDADDMVAPGAANMMLGFAAACDADLIYGSKAPFSVGLPPPLDGAQAMVLDNALRGLMLWRKFGNSFICRRSVAKDGSDERVFIQDTSLLLRAAAHRRRMALLTAPVVLYRQAANSLLAKHTNQDKVDLVGAMAFLLLDYDIPEDVRKRLLQRCLRHSIALGGWTISLRLIWLLSLLRIPPKGIEQRLIAEFTHLRSTHKCRVGTPRTNPALLPETRPFDVKSSAALF